ncbi:MAG: VWA domain-containing protein, partial [Planctomycetota bacterium]|nr:VWA domain-containing protein [Planctomycetota bacterium]
MIFDHPWLLTLLIFAALVPWLAWRSRAPIDGMRKTLVVILQCSAIALLALALSGPLIRGTPPTTRVAIIAHGPGAQTARLNDARQEIVNWREATPHSDPFHQLTTAASPDLANSLRHALALIPSGHLGEIALFTDQAHVGPPLAPLLAEITQQAARLHLRKIPSSTVQAAITTVRHPSSAQEQEAFRVVVSTSAAANETARIEIHEGDTLLATRAVTLDAGQSGHSIEVTPRGTGLVELETRLVIADAVDPQTGIERTALLIEGRTRVGHLSADDARFEALRSTLARRGIELVKGTDKVDALIVDDLPASAWDSKEQERIRDAVLHDGLGLMLAGAQSNLGPGGYTTSPLAEILPVDMPQHEERRDPSLSLVIIIDTSGSMGGNRVELAKEVARLAIRRLLPHDKVGIVEFYGSKRWAAPIQPASNTIEITRALNRLQAGGGTVIYSALEEAYYAMLNARTRFKHILVLTDGGVESAPFEQLARQMADAGQNLTTVLIGPQGNSPFLMNLANWGRGRFYACPSRFQLPDLRFKEPQSSLLPGVHRRSFPLGLRQRFEAIGSLEGEPLPATDGLVEARLRPGARLLVATGDQRPLLADWDQGRGRVQVYASELLGPMASALRAHPPYASFLADDLRALSRGSQAARPRLVMTAYETHLDVQVQHVSGPTWPVPMLKTEDLAVAMTPAERGNYSCRIEWPASETLEVTVETDGTLLRGGARRPLPQKDRAPIAPELDLLAATGTTEGELPIVPAELPLILQNGVVFVGSPSSTLVPIARSLALAALIAFLLSLLVRRWPARSPSRQVMTAVLPLLLALPLTAAQQDPIQQQIHEELRKKGHLDDLEKLWDKATPEQKFALARARGNLETALAWLPEEGRENDVLRMLLQDATGHNNEAISTLDKLLADEDAPTELRTQWLLRRAELHLATHNREAAREDFQQTVQTAKDPDYARRVGHLVAGYGLLDLALAWHLPTGSDPKADLTIFLRRALWQEQSGSIDSSLKEYDQAFAVATKRRDRQFVLSRTASLMRRAGRLGDLADRWLAKADKLPSQLHALLTLLREQGRGQQALELLEHTTDPDLQRLALEVAVENNQSELAFELARKQLAQRPDDRGLRISLALLLTDQRKMEEASKLLSNGITNASRVKNILALTRAAMELSLDTAIEHGLRKLRARETEKERIEGLILEANHLLQRAGKAAAIKVID